MVEKEVYEKGEKLWTGECINSIDEFCPDYDIHYKLLGEPENMLNLDIPKFISERSHTISLEYLTIINKMDYPMLSEVEDEYYKLRRRVNKILERSTDSTHISYLKEHVRGFCRENNNFRTTLYSEDKPEDKFIKFHFALTGMLKELFYFNEDTTPEVKTSVFRNDYTNRNSTLSLHSGNIIYIINETTQKHMSNVYTFKEIKISE